MGRPRDEYYWNQVTRNEENGMLKCKHCGKEFKGGVARIKAHLGKEKGRGIALCDRSSVPSNERVNNSTMATAGSGDPTEVLNRMNSFEVARHAHGTINNNIANPSNHQDVTRAINLFEVAGVAQEVIYNYMEDSLNHQYDTGPVDIPQDLANVDDVVGSSNGGFENEISEIKELIDVLTREEGSIEREIQWLESRTGQKRKRWTDVDDWLEEVEELKDRALEMMELLAQGWSTGQSAPEVQIKELIEDVHTLTEGKPLVLSNELMVGESFYDNLEKLFALVRDDKVLIIGVHGMGGVGKTTLVAHLKNKISRDRDFKHVFWVTVSQHFSIFKLQSGIAKRVGIKLDEDDEIVERAKMLSLALEKKDKFVLILDDVWNYIDPQKVGIPLRVNGIKLILTSRLKHVFQQMDCSPESIIQIKPLSPWTDDGWELFLLKLGCYGAPATLSHEVEKIARTIVRKCNGLPLGICVMARIMKGVDDIRQWRHVLNKFENSAVGEVMEVEVFRSLKLSYDHLMDKNIQNCFLLCALFPDNSANKLIMKLVDEGLIQEMKSLEGIFDEGHAILDQLKGHSLLLEIDDDYFLSMNNLVSDMVCCYVLKGSRYMVKCNKRLTKIPDEQEWADDLEKVSLMGNGIKQIPECMSPRCPRLSTLILSYNDFFQMPDCFFNYMDALTVLDLSGNKELISLPDSLSRLRSLKSLLLEGCYSLAYVPPLGELQELSRLVISYTSIRQVPKGLAMLFKLKWLDLSSNKELTFVPRSVLFGLTNVQYLDLWSTGVTVEVENVQEMGMLEYFSGRFHVNKNLIDYVENILDRGSGPKYYHLFLGVCNIVDFIKDGLLEEDGHSVHFGDCEAFNFLLPRDLHRLGVSKNEQLSGRMCEALSFKAPSSLRKILVADCPKVERLFCVCDPCSFCKHLQNLQSLHLSGLERLEVIWKASDEGICLPKLNYLYISGCNNMEKLLTPVSLRQLPNLETIHVWFCKSMKEIFAKESNEDDNIDSAVTLPKSFKELILWDLPQLRSVCASIIVSESRPTLDVDNCPSLLNGSLRYKSSHSDPNFVILL